MKPNYPQKIQKQITDSTVIDLINNDCNAALLGTTINEFSGTWINDPFATRKAENKLIQLKVAEKAAHCFGDSVYSALIESKELDWRENLDIPFKIVNLDENLKSAIRIVVRNLGLKMGIIDLKLSDDSTPIWLEINPQGQFLFVEGLSKLDLTSRFCEFLYSEAIKVKK